MKNEERWRFGDVRAIAVKVTRYKGAAHVYGPARDGAVVSVECGHNHATADAAERCAQMIARNRANQRNLLEGL